MVWSLWSWRTCTIPSILCKVLGTEEKVKIYRVFHLTTSAFLSNSHKSLFLFSSTNMCYSSSWRTSGPLICLDLTKEVSHSLSVHCRYRCSPLLSWKCFCLGEWHWFDRYPDLRFSQLVSAAAPSISFSLMSQAHFHPLDYYLLFSWLVAGTSWASLRPDHTAWGTSVLHAVFSHAVWLSACHGSCTLPFRWMDCKT